MMNFIKKTLQPCCAALLFALFLGTGSLAFAKEPAWAAWSEATLEQEGFKRWAGNSSLELYFNVERGIVAVRQIASGYVWYSSPLDWEEDEIAQGYFKNALPSLVQIRSRDKNGTIFPANSFTNVINRNGLKVKGIPNGFRATHNFTRDGVIIPVDITLDGANLCVNIDLASIELDTDWEIELIDLTLFPYFGAAPQTEEGYIFVPDGSGALIEFNRLGLSKIYEQHVYGRDPSIQPLQLRSPTETVLMPIFGLSREKMGYVAIIEGGAERSTIYAESANLRTAFNSAYAGFVVRDYDVVSFREKTGTPRDVPIFETGPLKGEALALRYVFLEGPENNYVGMANAYRSYLEKKAGFSKSPLSQEPSLFVNFIGSSRKVKPVFGVPMNVTIPYTPFKKAIDILEDIKGRGVTELTVKYDGWIKGGVKADYPRKARPESSLGGKRNLKRLLAWGQDNEVNIFGALDPVRLYKKMFAQAIEVISAKGINKAPVRILEYQLSTFTIKTDSRVHWILKKTKVTSLYKKFLASMKKFPSLQLAPDSLANFTSSDFGSKRSYYRNEAREDYLKLLRSSAESRQLLLSRPQAWALGTASYVCDLPIRSSSWDIISTDIPFYQILLKGYIPYSNEAANRALDRERYILSLVETGANPAYLFIAQKHEDLRDSPLESFMNTLAEDWVDDAEALWKELLPVLERLKGARIVGHELVETGLRYGSVRKTSFSNNCFVYTNYSTEPAQLPDGSNLEGLSYRLVEGEQK